MPAYVPGVPGSPKAVRPSKTLAKLREGKAVKMCACGHFLPFFVHYAAEAGYDCIWFDLEHRAMADREVQFFLQLCYSFDIDCLVRSPSTVERTKLYRYFEDGATGVMIPLLKTAEDAAKIVDAVKFPPIGNRGLDGAGVDAGFGSFEWPEDKAGDYVTEINKETFVVIQIERREENFDYIVFLCPALDTGKPYNRRESLANVEEICQVPGVDGLFFGPGDMGLRLSEKGGNVPTDPYYFPGGLNEARAKVAAAAKKHGVAWGQPAGSPEQIAELLAEGGRLLNLGGDFSLFQTLQDCGAQLSMEYDKAKL